VPGHHCKLTKSQNHMVTVEEELEPGTYIPVENPENSENAGVEGKQ
jgi:hypothetical protein